jgi:hypothetical protein
VLLHTAIRTGCIERGWWYLSSVLGVQNAFTNRWLIDPAQNDRSIRLKMTVAGRLKCTT